MLLASSGLAGVKGVCPFWVPSRYRGRVGTEYPKLQESGAHSRESLQDVRVWAWQCRRTYYVTCSFTFSQCLLGDQLQGPSPAFYRRPFLWQCGRPRKSRQEAQTSNAEPSTREAELCRRSGSGADAGLLAEEIFEPGPLRPQNARDFPTELLQQLICIHSVS